MLPYILAAIAAIAPPGTVPDLSNCSIAQHTTLDFDPKVVLSASARLEVRQCGGQEGSLVIALWSRNEQRPSVVLDTSDFSIVQQFVKDNVILVETSGGNRDQVFVFRYQRGIPRLDFKQVTKGQATIQSAPPRVRFTIPGIYAGQSPPETRTVEYKTDLQELVPSN